MIGEASQAITEHALSTDRRNLQLQRLADQVRYHFDWEKPIQPTYLHNADRSVICGFLIDGSLLIKAADASSGTTVIMHTCGEPHGVDNPSSIVVVIPDKAPLCDSEEALALAKTITRKALKASK